MLKIHGSSMDPLRISYGMLRVTQGQVCGCPFDCFFFICKPFPCQSVADPVRSVCFGQYLLARKRHGGKGCHKDIQDGYTDNKDTHGGPTDKIRKNYGYCIRTDFPEKSSMFDFFVMV